MNAATWTALIVAVIAGIGIAAAAVRYPRWRPIYYFGSTMALGAALLLLHGRIAIPEQPTAIQDAGAAVFVAWVTAGLCIPAVLVTVFRKWLRSRS